MARESAFPNLPETKTCPVCKKEFGRTRPSGTKISSREWFNKTYCSQKCVTDKRRRSGDNLFR